MSDPKTPRLDTPSTPAAATASGVHLVDVSRLDLPTDAKDRINDAIVQAVLREVNQQAKSSTGLVGQFRKDLVGYLLREAMNRDLQVQFDQVAAQALAQRGL